MTRRLSRPTPNEERLARRLLKDAALYDLTPIERRALHAVVLALRDNSVIGVEDLLQARRLFRVLARKFS